MRKLPLIIAAIMTAAIGFFAWRRQKEDAELDRALSARRRHLDNPEMDEDFAHQVTNSDQVAQAFRNSGAV
jgi:hypothetical protein